MSRILLVGEGDLAASGTAETRFAQLRLHQLHAALATEHEVVVCDARRDATAAAFSDLAAEAIVSAGTYTPTRTALAVAADLPLAIDLPGDPFADAQQVAAEGSAEEVDAEARAVFVPALLRGDVFLSVSEPSRHAIVGQLGVLGRLVRAPRQHEWVFPTPIAWSFPGFSEGPPRDPGARKRVCLVGGFNTWLDDEGLLAGLLRAMDRAPLEVDCIGGPIPGHHVAGFERFRSGARASAHAPRFHFLDPLPPSELAARLRACTHLLSLDRPGYEPELGSRTRLLFALHQGIRPVGTARCELARELAAGGWMTETGTEPDAVAAALLAPSPPLPDRTPLRDRYSIDRTTEGLRSWARAPRRVDVGGAVNPVLALARERDQLRDTLRATWASPTWRALDWIRRRGRG